MASYKQFFYLVDVGVNSGDIGPTKRAQIAKATLNLQLATEILIATCCGGYNTSEAPEIALVVPSDVRGGDFKAQVEKELAKRGLDATVTVKDDTHDYTFTEEQLDNIAEATRVDDMEEAYRAVDRMCAYDISKGHDDVNKDLADSLPNGDDTSASAGGQERAGVLTDVRNFPPHQLGEPAAVSQTKYTHLKDARDANIEKLMKALFNGLERLGKATNTNTMVTIMLAEGFLSVGKFMWTAYTTVPWGGSLTVWLGSVVAGAGGPVVVGAAVAVIVLSFGILWLLVKEATNGLVLLNGLPTPMYVLNDYIINGLRTSVVTNIAGYYGGDKDKPRAYPYGLFVYDKVPYSAFGSTLGIAINSNRGPFALGLDCPNIQRNSVAAVAGGGDTARLAAEKADQSADAEAVIRLSGATVTIRRADSRGTVNYCLATMV